MKRASSAKRKRRRGKNNKLKLVVFIGMFIYVSWVIITQQIEIEGKKKALCQISSQIAAQQQTKQQLEKKMELVSSKEYLERVAREQLGFARPDEIIFYDATLKK